MKLSIRQANQDFLKNSDLMTSNKVLPNKENHLENSHTGKSLNQPSDSEVVNDSLFLQHSNSKEDSKEEVGSLNRNNHPSVDTKSTTSKPQGLPKDLVLNNKIVSDSGLYNLSQPITEVSQQANIITDKTINSPDILSKQVLKNIVEPKQFVENSDENLIEYFDETLSLDVDNVFSMNKTISDIKPSNTFSDNANTRFSQDTQFQTNQVLQSKQTNEAYLAHQVSETLNHNLASDTAHIQKNNVQLQQETIAIFRKDFADAVKDKVLVMINQKLQQFDITLDPPEFGNMQVRVNLQGEQASVNFVVQNQQAKEALEQNMQKLKDMLAEQGVDVGDANVDQKNQGEQNSQGDSFVSSESTNDNVVSEGEVEQVFSADLFNSPVTAIDYYA
jgi:flagellar hook-length control protein FliK